VVAPWECYNKRSVDILELRGVIARIPFESRDDRFNRRGYGGEDDARVSLVVGYGKVFGR
jgi:hypothetical protein